MPELSLRSLVRNGWAGKTALIFLSFALALDLLQPTLAQTEEPREEPSHEVGGMMILKIPFGTTNDDQQLIPEIGFSLSVSRPGKEIRKPERFDQRTGAKLPEHDLEQIRTWSLEELEPLAMQVSKTEFGHPVPQEYPAGPSARIKGLSKYGVPILTGK